MTQTIVVALADRKDAKNWTQRETDWPGYLAYARFDDPADYKECGAILSATLRNTTRTKDTVVNRYVVTMDVDYPTPDFFADLLLTLPDTELAWHSTWSYTPATPRYRLHIPLARDVTPTEYARLTRALAHNIGRSAFDPSSFAPTQYAFLASTQDQATYVHEIRHGEWLDPEPWLAMYPEEARDTSLEPAEGPPTPAQCDKALTILRKYADEIRNGVTRDGVEVTRNSGLIARLPVLLRFVLAGALTGDEVYDTMLDAVAEAPGDHAFTLEEYLMVFSRAEAYATEDGPGLPTVIDDFTTPPPATTAPPPAPGNPAATLPPGPTFVFSPTRYLRTGGGLEVEALARHLDASLGLARCELSGTLLRFHGGSWRADAEKVVRAAVTTILGDLWTPARGSSVLKYFADADLREIPEMPTTPSLVNTFSGMVEPVTGAVLPHDPGLNSRQQIPHPYDPEATCPEFDAYLASSYRPDQIPVVWEIIGYSLLPTNPYHRAVLLYGPKGRNGKGVFTHTLQALVGSENCSHISIHDLGGNRFAEASLFGKLVNLAGDQDASFLANTGKLKTLIAGDPISADVKNKARFRFTPTALSIFATNKLFKTTDASEAFLNRFIVVKYDTDFFGREDLGLKNRLATESELRGILARAIEALGRLLARGRFDLSPEMIADTAEAGATVGGDTRAWVHEYATLDPDSWTKGTALYDAYCLAARDDGTLRPLRRRDFYADLRQIRDVTGTERDGYLGFKGIRLNPAAFEEFL